MTDDLGFIKPVRVSTGYSRTQKSKPTTYGPQSKAQPQMRPKTNPQVKLKEPFKVPATVNEKSRLSRKTAETIDDPISDNDNDRLPSSHIEKTPVVSSNRPGRTTRSRAQDISTKASVKVGVCKSPRKEARGATDRTREREPSTSTGRVSLSPSPVHDVKLSSSELGATEGRKKFIRVAFTASPEPETSSKKEFVKLETLRSDGESAVKRPKRVFNKVVILEDIMPTLGKRSLKIAGMLEETENTKDQDSLSLPAANPDALKASPKKKFRTYTFEPSSPRVPSPDLDAQTTRCPMCKAPVPFQLYSEFSNNQSTMTTRQQAAFCTHHRQNSATSTYSSLGYPTINWDIINERFESHYDYISRLITSPGETPSHYRPLFASDIKHGRNRTIKQSILGAKGDKTDNSRVLVPGYYGTRGARAMQEAILLRFNKELRRVAVTDVVVSARAVGGYVSSVLVPELGTRLIMEDMNIGEEKAREVMEKSAGIGGLVNEELKDIRRKEKEVDLEESFVIEDDYA